MRIKLIDFLKGFSILTIVMMHYAELLDLPGFLNIAKPFGGAGVHVFLFLSGFSLYLSISKKNYTYLDFIKKRFVKIYIPYLIAILIIALVSIFTFIFPNDWKALTGHVFLFKMFNERLMTSYGYHFWFISTIFQFYFIMPFLVYFAKKIKLPVLFIISVIISASWMGFVSFANLSHLKIWNSFFLQFLWEFVLGMLLAELYLKEKLPKINIITIIVIAVFSLACYAFLALKFPRFGKAFNDFPALFGYGFLGIILYKMKVDFINKGLIQTGNISYSLYLYHIVIFMLLFKVLSIFHINFNYLFYFLFLAAAILLSFPIQKMNDYIVAGLNQLGIKIIIRRVIKQLQMFF